MLDRTLCWLLLNSFNAGPMQNIALSNRRDRRIALLKPKAGRDGKAAHAMQLLNSMLWAFKGTTRSAWETSGPEEADVVVFHADDVKDDRLAYWRANGKLAVQITTGDQAGLTDRHALIYPFRAAQAFALLERLDEELQSAQVSANPAIPATASWEFVESLQQFRGQSGPQSWSVTARKPFVWVCSGGAGYFADAPTLLAIRQGALSLEAQRLIPTVTPPVEVPLRPEAELSWFAAYNASPELLPGLSATAGYRLSRWPDFGSIHPPTGQIRAAALLASQSLDVSQLARRARIPADEAVRFLNALWVHGRLTASMPVTAPAERPVPARGGFGSLLRKLRQHLGLGV